MKSLKKEVNHLYDDTTDALIQAISLDKKNIYGHDSKELSILVEKSTDLIDLDTQEFYDKKIKYLYSDIITYASLSQENMNMEQSEFTYALKVACRQIVETIKDSNEIQKNIKLYINHKNNDIKAEYNFLRVTIAKTLNGIAQLRNNEDDIDILTNIKLLEERLKKLDMIGNGKIDNLIRNNKIEPKMATSLINDSAFAYDISKKLLSVACVLWIEDKELLELGDEL
jgi:phosphate:Na+ symporter